MEGQDPLLHLSRLVMYRLKSTSFQDCFSEVVALRQLMHQDILKRLQQAE
jgi:hypothetical protein